jgi:GT2 family glycosyltransferase/glycosyltransferase involved in cell wall biosynthesis
MRILQIVHGFPPAASGGTEIYVHDLSLALAAWPGDEVSVLTRDADPHKAEYSVRRTDYRGLHVAAINNTFQACESFEDSYANPAIRAIVSGLLDELQPDVAHVQHLTCLSTGLVEELAVRRIPIVMTLNDYWLICHRGQLVDADGRRCDGPFGGGCSRCLQPGLLAGPSIYRAGRLARSWPMPGAAWAVRVAAKSLEAVTPGSRPRRATLERLHHMRAAVRHVDLFLAPSGTLERQFLRFGIPRDRLLRCEQGIDIAPFERVRRPPSDVLRLGFAGGLIPTKAPHVLLEAIARLPAASVSVSLFGTGAGYYASDDYGARLAPLLAHPSVHRIGPVPHERMPEALASIDVLVVPSVWIENAPFIIREAFASGAPVIASDLGGMAEMVRHEIDGLRFPPGDAGALAACVGRLLERPSDLARLREGIARPLSIEADAAAVRRFYAALRSGVVSQPRGTAGRGTATHSGTATLGAVVLNYRTPDQTWLAVRSLQTSRTPPHRLFVVDNASGDGSAPALRASLEGIDLIERPANDGYSAGCNAGIRAALDAGVDFVLLVNSDVVLAPDAIDRLGAAMLSDLRPGIAGPVLLSRDEPDRIASAGISFSTRTGRMRHRGAGLPLSLLSADTLHPTDAVSGCVMLIHRDVFDRIGLLDEHYFFSFEDIDFCLRARDAGFSTVCTADAVAYHEGGRSIGRRSPRRVYFATRNHLRLARRMGTGAGGALRAAFIVAANTAYVLVAPDAPLARGLAAVGRGAWHHVLRRYGAG